MANYKIPTIIVHELVAGNTFTGVTSDGVPVGQLLDRIMIHTLGTQGGEIESVEKYGMSVAQIFYNGVGTTNVAVYIEDADGFRYKLMEVSLADPVLDPTSFVFEPRLCFVPENGKLICISTGNLTANGRFGIVRGRGWTPDTIAQIL